MSEGLAIARGDYLAIFDADFVPPADSLQRAMPCLLSDARLGFVEARWGHLNRDASLLTRLQAVSIDGHFRVEQFARDRCGYLMNFNGMHGGVFAAQTAIEAIRAGAVSAQCLHRYEEKWDAEFGKLYRRLRRIRHAVLKVPEDRLGKIIHEAAQLDAQHMSVKDLMLIVMKSHPQLLLEVGPYFLGQ